MHRETHEAQRMERQEKAHWDCQMKEMLAFQNRSPFRKISAPSSRRLTFQFFTLGVASNIWIQVRQAAMMTMIKMKLFRSKEQESSQ